MRLSEWWPYARRRWPVVTAVRTEQLTGWWRLERNPTRRHAGAREVLPNRPPDADPGPPPADYRWPNRRLQGSAEFQVDPVRIAERQNRVIEVGEFFDFAVFDAGLAQSLCR